MRESKLEKLFCDRCKEAGLLVRKLKWIGRRGAPDRIVIGCRGTNVQFAEIKAPGEKLDDHQQREYARLVSQGAVVHVIDSGEAVDRFIRRNA